MKVVFGEVVAKVKPGRAEVRASFELFSRIASFVKKEYGLSAKLMGSVAKDTFLSGDKDLDIFVFFSVSFSRKELEKKGLEIGKAVFEKFGCRDYTVSYAEHPYTKGVIEGYEVEVVPAYSIKSTKKLRSAVDRTPFHTEYVLSNLKNHDEVRIFKRFLKGIGCYGSDLKTEGFSGYLCELLIIHYGTFRKVISEAQKWREQQIIDVGGLYSQTDYKKVRRMFRDQPLIVVDPVDKKRNVAAVLSVEKLARFMIHARKFEQKPEQKYFFARKRQIDTRQVVKSCDESGIKIYAVVFERPDVIEDVLYPQLRKMLLNFGGFLGRNDFKVVDSWVFADGECGVGFKVMNVKVMKHKVVTGPSVFNPLKHQDGFIKMHKKVWLEDDRYIAEVKRDCCLIDEGIRMFYGGSLKALADKGVPMNLAKMICKGFRVLAGRQVLKIKSAEFWCGAERENIK
ncbi:MAG: CCA tRNA nucleotidyltransferase [archaeon]|nr:CCA tRNA nucleotidyltransferase [archaeon]